MHIFPLLLSVSSASWWHSLHPETWTAVCFLGTSVWVAASFLTSREEAAFWQRGAMAGLPSCRWVAWACLGSLLLPRTPCLRKLPRKLPCHSLFARPVRRAPGHSRSLGFALVLRRVTPLSPLAPPPLSQSCPLVSSWVLPALRGRGGWGAFSLPVLLTAWYCRCGKGSHGAVVHSRAFRLGGFAQMSGRCELYQSNIFVGSKSFTFEK